MGVFSLTYDIEDIQTVARQILTAAPQQKIFLFYGEMGAGKTTFIKALCRHLGVDGASSPTFSIVNEYSGTTGKIFHFDFYRLKDENEALDMGYEEYFYSGDYCFIEWPGNIPNLLPPHYAELHLTTIGNDTRGITLNEI